VAIVIGQPWTRSFERRHAGTSGTTATNSVPLLSRFGSDSTVAAPQHRVRKFASLHIADIDRESHRENPTVWLASIRRFCEHVFYRFQPADERP
jgi:hypothetical protein